MIRTSFILKSAFHHEYDGREQQVGQSDDRTALISPGVNRSASPPIVCGPEPDNGGLPGPITGDLAGPMTEALTKVEGVGLDVAYTILWIGKLAR